MASWAPQSLPEDGNTCSPDPKPPRREKASRGRWDEIRAHFAGQCCASCGLGDQLELHHCVPKSQRGSDIVENLVVLCRSCHTKLEGHETGWEQVAGHVRAFIMARSSRYAYVMGMLGEEGFARRYPEPPFLAIGDLDSYKRPDPWLRDSEDVEGHSKP
jgi:hypothetical protein